MCGRVRLSSDYSEIKIKLKFDGPPPNFERDWNKPLTAPMLVAIRSMDGRRTPKMMRWGLLPHWAKDEKIAYSTFNARAIHDLPNHGGPSIQKFGQTATAMLGKSKRKTARLTNLRPSAVKWLVLEIIKQPNVDQQRRRRMAFTVMSNSFRDGDYLPHEFILSANFGFGCSGGNRSPHLRWRGAPQGTKSFAVTCYDPDAPTGSGFWHWLVVNIPADVSELAEGAGSTGGQLPPEAMQTRTDFGEPGYGGPCPPEGDHPHRYLFTVFAVKADKLNVTSDTSAAVVGFNLHFNTLAKAEIMGLFKR